MIDGCAEQCEIGEEESLASASESGALGSVGGLGGHSFSLCALSHFALGRLEVGEQGSRLSGQGRSA
jgi:hypothetical protein